MEGFAMDTVARNNAGHVSDTEGWLDDLMQTPELSLAELAESNPNYRLAVVDTQHGIGFQEEADDFMVVKMEDK